MNTVLIEIIELILLFLWVAPIVIAGMTWHSVRGLAKASGKLQDADPGEHEDAYSQAAEHRDWAKEHGFTPGGTWVVTGKLPTFLAVWNHESDPTYFVFYVAGAHSYIDFVTRLSDDEVVTTSSSTDGLFFPMPPGFYMEAFTGTDKDTLLLKHRRSVDFLKAALTPKAPLTPVVLKDLVIEAISSQVAYIRSLPLWPFRGIYWFLFRRQSLANKSIEECWKSQTVRT
jgi:hypothetical protein